MLEKHIFLNNVVCYLELIEELTDDCYHPIEVTNANIGNIAENTTNSIKGLGELIRILIVKTLWHDMGRKRYQVLECSSILDPTGLFFNCCFFKRMPVVCSLTYVVT